MPKGVRVTIPHEQIPEVLAGLSYRASEAHRGLPETWDEEDHEEVEQIREFAGRIQVLSVRQKGVYWPRLIGADAVAAIKEGGGDE